MRQNKIENNAGMTLLELMIVVSVVAILVALAIPSLTDSRKVTNESATIAALRNLCSAQEMYRNRFGVYGGFDELAARNLIDPTYQQAARRGYVFSAGANGSDSWVATAVPQEPGSSGDRYFFIDESAVIRFSETGNASSGDPAVE